MSNTISHFWSSPLRHFIYSRWTVIVLLNAVYPFILWLNFVSKISNISSLIGIVLAVASFVVIYAELESWLLRKRYTQLAKQLKLAASIRIATFSLYFIDLFTGYFALLATLWLTGIKTGITQDISYLSFSEIAASYITTIIVGFLSSIVVALLILVIIGITKLWLYFKKRSLTQ